ncbi:MAG: hypothetical protein M0017_06565 [Desulfobacteraceae bacterium]|nr:hypothetical protein [Desulfobacteraceae bacterium]
MPEIRRLRLPRPNGPPAGVSPEELSVLQGEGERQGEKRRKPQPKRRKSQGKKTR